MHESARKLLIYVWTDAAWLCAEWITSQLLGLFVIYFYCLFNFWSLLFKLCCDYFRGAELPAKLSLCISLCLPNSSVFCGPSGALSSLETKLLTTHQKWKCDIDIVQNKDIIFNGAGRWVSHSNNVLPDFAAKVQLNRILIPNMYSNRYSAHLALTRSGVITVVRIFYINIMIVYILTLHFLSLSLNQVSPTGYN